MSFKNIIRNKEANAAKGRKEFMELVEAHQKAWGTDTYTGKPSLQQLLDAKVVAFWHPTGVEMALTATLHKSLDEIHDYVTHLVWHTKVRLPVVRLHRVFVNQQPMKIKSVKVVFENES